MSATALIVAAGRSERFGGAVPKQFRELAGKPVLMRTIGRFETAESIDRIVVVVAEEHLLYTNEKIVNAGGFRKVEKIVIGGDTRVDSVRRGLESLRPSTRLVAIHDGARPLVDPSDIDRVVALASQERAAMLAVPVAETVKRVKGSYILSTLDRDGLYLAQTPQVFQYDLILAAHREAGDLPAVTDDAMLVEKRGFKVCVLEPASPNPKITTRLDMIVAEALLKEGDNV